MDEVLNAILKDTYTKAQLKHRLVILKSYLLKAFFGAYKTPMLDSSDLSWLSSLPKLIFKNFNKDNVYKIFESIEGMQETLSSLTVYLPIEATENICLQIGSYARKTFRSTTMLLDTKYDPALIAGAAFVWKGVYRDYSLRAKIEERKEEILGSFKKFLK